MYIGITEGKQKKFKKFLSGNSKLLKPSVSNNDKIKCLYLLRCSAEVQDSNFLDAVKNMFTEKVIDLSNKSLSETDMKTLAILLLHLPDGPWSLNLSRCNISNRCCKILFESYISQTTTANIGTIDISFNNISSENFHLCRLCYKVFKPWQTKRITLSIDALYNSGTINRVKHFKDVLQNLTQKCPLSSGKLMILYQAKQTRLVVVYSDLKYVKCFQLYNCELNQKTAKNLSKSVTEQLKGHRVYDVFFSYSHHDIEILSYIVKNFEQITFCGSNMHSKGAYLLDVTSKVDFDHPLKCLEDYLAAVIQNDVHINASCPYLSMVSEKIQEQTKEMLRNISTLKVLDLTNNNLCDCIADDLELILSCNILEELYLGGNNLQEVGVIKIADALQANSVLKVFDISNNSIKIKAVDSIATTLANKFKLQKLYINGNKLHADSINKIVEKVCSTSLKTFNVSRNISDTTDAAIAKVLATATIADMLSKNTQLEELHLGENILHANGIIKIVSGLKNTTTLKVFDISNNDISDQAAAVIADTLSEQGELEELILGGNNLQDGLVTIVKKLRCYSTLKILDICNNSASTTTINCIAILLCFKSKLSKFYLGGNNLVEPKTLQALHFFLAETSFDVSCTINDEAEENIQRAVFRNVAHMQMLLLDHNTKILANEYSIYKLLSLISRLNLKYDRAKIVRSIGKCVYEHAHSYMHAYV